MEPTSNQARALMSLLGKPINVVDKIREDRRKASWKYVSEKLFPKTHNHHIFTKEIELTRSAQLLDLDFRTILKDIPELHTFKELYIKRLVLNYEPFICRGMSGMLSLLFCDFRSSLMDNILKMGFTLPVAEEAQGLTICPGYKVSLNDPNFHKIFRFLVLVAGLDLEKNSIFGKLSLVIHFTLGKSGKIGKSTFDSLTLVGTAKAVSLYSDKHGPPLVEESDFNDLESVFKSLEDNSDPKVQCFNTMSDALKRTMSLRNFQPKINIPRRFSDFSKNDLEEGLGVSEKAEGSTSAAQDEKLSPVLHAKGPCGYKHFLTKEEIHSAVDSSFL